MRILTLIGMPGSGKSAVGRIIASRLGWNFLDTDSCIEERHGTRLQALIDQVGDESFRRLEEGTILDLAIPEQTVISTGGSVVYSNRAMRHLASISTVIFLDAPLEAIRKHIGSEAPRGIVGMTEGGLEELYQQRLPCYRRHAAIIVSFNCETTEEAATKVLSALPNDLQPADPH
ncbi:MAG: shikimate kinase [Geobacteraceae bacterium GWC2_58_44]|nr:MAG: shikimate kinase [Geobacteraceae bacterium GWC2_58_44]HBG08207.1 shikimate kinase [Geobacter sp.]